MSSPPSELANPPPAPRPPPPEQPRRPAVPAPASELANTPPATPPFDIVRAAFVELHVSDLEASERFYAGLLGMIVSARTPDAVYLRGWEERQHHSLILRQAPIATAARLGFRVRSEDDLDRAAAHFAGEGLTTRWIEAGADP